MHTKVELSDMKLKVLCIHGYRQNETTFREKSGALRKLLKRHVDFVFVTAPHTLSEDVNLAIKPDSEQDKGWWFSRPNKGYYALDNTDISTGFEESLKLIEEAFETLGPFDGVLGFSQGAAFVSLLCVLRNDPKNKLDFKFAILISGFKSMLAPHEGMYSAPIDCSSFHVIGATDAVIPSQSSEELVSVFVNPAVYRHNGGHYVPASAALRTALNEFVAPFIT